MLAAHVGSMHSAGCEHGHGHARLREGRPRPHLCTPSSACRPLRYADVVVHRLLAATLRLASVPDAAHERRELKALVDNLNARHRGAQARAPHRGFPARLALVFVLHLRVMLCPVKSDADVSYILSYTARADCTAHGCICCRQGLP